MFDQNSFIQFMLEHKVVGTFSEPITLKSGRQSSWYVNWRVVAQDVFLMDQISDYVLQYCTDNNIEVDTFYGVAEGATKLGLLCQYKHAKRSDSFSAYSHRWAMGRGKSKEHGNIQDRHFLGLPKGKTLVLEDVTTSGISLFNAIDSLKEANVDIVHTMALTNRMDDPNINVPDKISDMGLSYSCLSNGKDLLSYFLKHTDSKNLPDAFLKEARLFLEK